ncbi:MAG: DUF1858 domain-containing protein [Firmicutes bacterium]|nr:DUF1858 domain-containing protein [Bacillota bacterium]
MQKITPDMTIHNVLQAHPETVQVFLSFGMHCLGCPGARGETVGQAAAKHGVDLAEMLEKLNEVA